MTQEGFVSVVDRLRAALEAGSASARLQTAMAAGLRPDDAYIDPIVERFAIEPDFFVRDMLTDADDRAIVLSVVHLAQSFGREVIAEGVETMEHAQALIDIGCHLGQGFGIARPMPPTHIPGWMSWYTASADTDAPSFAPPP